tara:strand:+ start:10835 stop:14323 length:3489 start_codon:yes stop_codon:yes gene_type:complete
MSLIKFLTRLDEVGVGLSLDAEGMLRIEMPEGALSGEDIAFLKSNKSEIINVLRQLDAGPAAVLLPKAHPDPEARFEPFPLTDIQEAYLVGRKGLIDGHKVSTHYYGEYQAQALDVERLEAAFNHLIVRHDMLRAVITDDGHQQILEQVPLYKMARHDLRSLDAHGCDRSLKAVRERLSHQIVCETRWPLFDVELSLLQNGAIHIHISVDLLIADFYSLMLLLREWSELYLAQDHLQAPSKLSFRDYVLAEQRIEQTSLFCTSQSYWMQRAAALPPGPELPRVPASQMPGKNKFVRLAAELPAPLWSNLKQWCKSEGVTPSGVLLTLFGEILARWSNSDSFTIAMTIFNRLPLHPEVDKIVGDFTSSMLFEYARQDGRSTAEQAKLAQRQLWADIEHKHFSAVRLIRAMNQTNPNTFNHYPVVFTSALASNSASPADMNWDLLGEEVFGISQTPQVCLDHVVTELKGTLWFHWDVRADIYPTGMIEDMFEAYQDILHSLCGDEASELYEIGFEQERETAAVSKLSQSDRRPDAHRLLHELVETAAARCPDAVAVIQKDHSYTYDQLMERARAIASLLQARNVKPNDVIGIHTDNRYQQIYCALGVQMSGAAYLPLDTSWPPSRINEILDIANAKLILGENQHKGSVTVLNDRNFLTIDDAGNSSNYPADALHDVAVSPDDLAYVIFTSGSTGQPKGVMIEHAAAVNTILDINERFAITAEDRVLAISSFCFDLSVYDIFGVLAAGGTIVTVDYDFTRIPQPEHWRKLVESHRITVWNSVPALMQLLVEITAPDHAVSPLNSLRVVMLSGDWIPTGLPLPIKNLAPEANLYSLGGATEASIWSIYYEIENVDQQWPSIPYGKPLSHQDVAVLSQNQVPCPTYVPGEIYIAGDGLARGYIGRQDLTDASFLIDDRTGKRLYRTGDLGRLLPDGNIEFLGRRDTQVKVGGHRIELSEIEMKLSRLDPVQACTVIAPQNTKGHKVLVAFWVARGEETSASHELREALALSLPIYMVPAIFRRLDRLPITANGKIDRTQLARVLEQECGADTGRLKVAAAGLERTIVELIVDETSQAHIDVDTNFFELGISSLELVRILSRLQMHLGEEISPVMAFSSPTVRLLAGAISNETVDVQEKPGQSARSDARKNIRARRRAKLDRRGKNND